MRKFFGVEENESERKNIKIEFPVPRLLPLSSQNSRSSRINTAPGKLKPSNLSPPFLLNSQKKSRNEAFHQRVKQNIQLSSKTEFISFYFSFKNTFLRKICYRKA
jgi:hypothetical protein